MSASRILIVDDDAALLTALTGALELRMPEVSVDSCDSAKAAIQKIARAEYDAVVTDIKMPGMDGLTLLREIRSRRPDLPTLLITGHGQHDLAIQALRGGAFDFIQKPIERDYFVAALTRAVRMREMDRQLQQQQEALANHAAELERAVQVRTEQLREANRRKDEFLATLSHELRNPLAPIRSGLDLLAMEDGANRETISLMQEHLQHLARLVDDLLDVSRIMRGRIELRKESVQLSTLIERSVEAVGALMDGRQQELVVVLPKQPIWLNADPVRLVQIIENLLHNAFKYSDAEGRIELIAEIQGSEALIRVRDTGIGIEPELLPKVFDLFVQSSRSLDRAQGGLGIGLTLVQRLVEMHDGTISAHSEGPGQGSTFLLRLPVAEGSSQTKQPVNRPHGSRGRRILVVDDQVGGAKLLGMLLHRLGHHDIETAHDGPSALKKIKEIHPEIVLLDIGLPGMDGYQVARTIREMREFDDVLLAALTGYGQEEDRQRSKEAGFDRHLVKPVETSELERLLTGANLPTS